MAGSPQQARKLLQLVSRARGLEDLSEQDEAVRAVVLPLQPADHASFLAGMEGVLTAAATTALRIIAEQRRPGGSTRGRVWGTLAAALGCAGAVCSLTATLLERLAGQQQQPAAADQAAAKGLLLAMVAAATTAAGQLSQPCTAAQSASPEAACLMQMWLGLGCDLLKAAAPTLGQMLECDSTPAWCASEVEAVCAVLPRLAVSVLRSDAAMATSGLPGASALWASAIRVVSEPMLQLHRRAAADKPWHGELAHMVDLTLLCAGLHAAAVHQRQAGRSDSIPADAVMAAGLSSSSSGGGGGGSGGSSSSSQPHAPALLVVPAFHKALLQQVVCLDMMLHTLASPLADDDSSMRCVFSMAATLDEAAVEACSVSLVPLLQVLVELAALNAHRHAFVRDAVSAMLQLVQGSADQALGSSSATIRQGTPLQLQPVQAAGLLAPVLHLLSAAVLHVLGPPGDAVTAADPLASDLACCFAALVAAVVLPVKPEHLAAAICRQPLRSLAALELTVRLWAAGLVPQLEGAVAADGAPLVLKLVATVAEACTVAVYSSKLAAVLQGSDSVAVSLVHNHLLALLSTCLKVCTRARGSAAVCVQSGAVRIAVNVGSAALGVVGPTSALWPDTSSSSSSQAAISRCGTTHWLFIMGRSLVEFSQRSMQLVSSQLLQEGELPAASAAGAAAIIQAAGHAATRPGATPPGAALSLQRVDVAAASAGGGGLLMLCDGDITRPGETDARLSVMLRQLRDSLAQQQQACSSSGATSGPQLETLQQLAHAASDVQQQLDGWCAAARRAALEFNEASQHSAEALVRCYIMAMSQNSDGVRVLLDAQGQPIVRQHGLLNVLHHLQRLHRLGAAVCAVLPPPSLACANPGCDNVSGLSDMQLVWRRGVCGHCREARFCSVACLRAHWAALRDPGTVVAAVLGGESGGV